MKMEFGNVKTNRIKHHLTCLPCFSEGGGWCLHVIERDIIKYILNFEFTFKHFEVHMYCITIP